MSSELTQGDNEGCLTKPRGLNQGMGRPLAGRMEQDAQKKGLGSLPNGNSLAASLDRGWIGPQSVRPEPSLIS